MSITGNSSNSGNKGRAVSGSGRREGDEAESPDPDKNREDPRVRRAVTAKLAYVLANSRVTGFKRPAEYPPADEHDLCEDRSPRQQQCSTAGRIGQKRPPCRSEPKRNVT